MDNRARYNLFGFIYALSLSLSFLAAFFYLVNRASQATIFAMQEDPVVTVSLIESKDMTQTAMKQESLVNDSVKSEEPIEDIDSLFDTVETQKVVLSKNVKVKEDAPLVNPEFIKNIQTRTLPKETNKQKKQGSNELSLDYREFKADVTPSGVSKGEKDEYRAKIHQILYARWHHKSDQLRKVVVYIKISPSGSMTYRIKQFSGDETFDISVKMHLEYLLDQTFPASPDGNYADFVVNFMSKEQ